MRLLFIRHGDPNYVNDCLTEIGKVEADALAKHIEEWNIDDCYLSPKGRAIETASYSLKAMEKSRGKEIETITYPWLREFDASVDMEKNPEYLEAFPDASVEEGTLKKHIVWDIVPEYLNNHPEYYDNHGWRNTKLAEDTDLLEQYDWVIEGIDNLLAQYGYVRDGMSYRVEKECTKTLAFFCHYGLTCTVLSHMLNCSPFALWHGIAMAPTSVTEIITEERQPGRAQFRAWKIGDISHLAKEGIDPSFSARFAEVYSDKEHRH